MDEAVDLLIEAGPPNTGADEPPKTGAPLPANNGEAVVPAPANSDGVGVEDPPNRAGIKIFFSMTVKGQIISECPFEILDFPKISQKI